MKKLFRIFAISILALSFAGCDDQSEEQGVEQLTINYRNMRGTWQLSQFEGAAIEGDAYFYITFSLDDDDLQHFDSYTNFDSAFASKSEGEYTIEEDDSFQSIITGVFDNQFLEPWSGEYIITSFTAEDMEWVDSESGERREYIRVDEVPADILAGTRAE